MSTGNLASVSGILMHYHPSVEQGEYHYPGKPTVIQYRAPSQNLVHPPKAFELLDRLFEDQCFEHIPINKGLEATQPALRIGKS